MLVNTSFLVQRHCEYMFALIVSIHVCPSEIYCTGELLKQVQTAKLFDDNKAFVDMKLTSAPGEDNYYLSFALQLLTRLSVAFSFCSSHCWISIAEVVLDAFSNLTQKFPDKTVPPSDLRVFVNTYFSGNGTEFEPWTPSDWHEK